MIEIRVLSADDWPLWRDLRQAALAEAPYAFGSSLADWQGEGDREERWRGRLSGPGSHNVVAFLEGEPAGMGTGAPAERAPGQPEVVAEVLSMWVAPAARGRGVGDAVLASVETWARSRGFTRLRLDVAPDNPAATALYERNGFVPTDEEGDLMPDGVRRETVMVKRLDRQVSPPMSNS